MHNSKTCPKCRSTDIVRIPGKHYGFGSGNIIKVGPIGLVKVTRYLCASCGFSEEWIDDPDDIAKLKEKYAS
jgi:predicted nucleic-acid-binding Zn-ribbon protein